MAQRFLTRWIGLGWLVAAIAFCATAYAAPRLETAVYVADDAAFDVTSTLIFGPTEAVLIDAQYRNSDAAKVADMVEAKHRRLKAIFVTHPDEDHYLGLAVLHQRFPETPIYMTPAALKEFLRVSPAWIKERRKSAPDETPQALPQPLAVPQATLSVDGQQIEILADLQGDYGAQPLNSALWLPSERILVTGDFAFNGIHPWTYGSSAAGRAAWRQALARLLAYPARTIIAGHKKTADLPDTAAAITATGQYLADFDAVRQSCPDKACFIGAMKAKYPALGQADFIKWAAESEYKAPATP